MVFRLLCLYSMDSNVTMLLEFRLLIDGYAKIESHEHNKKNAIVKRVWFEKFLTNLSEIYSSIMLGTVRLFIIFWLGLIACRWHYLFFLSSFLVHRCFFFVESNQYSNSYSLNEQKCFIKIHRSDFSCLYHWYRFIFKRFIWFDIHDNRLLLFQTSYLWIFSSFYFFLSFFLPYHILFSHAHQL